MSKSRNLSDLLDANGDVVSGALDNVPPSNDASALTTGTLPVDRVPYLGRRNLIINGAMQVWQRGTSVPGITGTGYYSCDRWGWASNCEETITQSQSTDAPDEFSNSLKIEVTTAETSVSNTENARIQYAIEGQDLQHLAYGTSSAKSLTISFWVKSSVTGNYNCTVEHIDALKYYANVYTINSANTWEYKTVTVQGYTSTAINNDNAARMLIHFGLTSGNGLKSGSSGTWGDSTSLHSGLNVDIVSTNGATFYITGVQLEVGSVATPFEHRSYGEELALCQRYYWKQSANNSFMAVKWMESGRTYDNRYLSEHYFPVTMRTTPTFTVSCVDIHFMGVAFSPVSGASADGTKDNAYVQYTMDSALDSNIVGRPRSFVLTADAEL